jgi:BirA family biotin operon repressor/biotin-[acetyl-CoA-carboxylase] ligase
MYTAAMARDAQNDRLSEAQWALLRVLADGGEHGAAELGQAVSGTNADIGDLISQFESLGLCVVTSPGGGWKLTAPLDLLSESAIRSHLQDGLEVPEIRLLGSTGSTNDLLRRWPTAPNGLVYLAEHQAAGRGRRGRGWVSPLASNLALSISWQYPSNFGALGWVSLAMGVSIADALEAIGFAGIGLKWPNDLVVGDAKLGGLLIELDGPACGPLRLVCGVGINVWMGESDRTGIDQPWTSLARLGVPAGFDRNALAAALISACIDVLSRMPTEQVEVWRRGWSARDSLKGRAVSVRPSGAPHEYGIAGGVGFAGEFVLKQGDRCRRYASAEVSVRPVQ